MTTFFLIRHGEAEHNMLNVASSLPEGRVWHLTARGREQIEECARELAASGAPIAVLLHSPLARARETAEILARTIQVPLREDVRLAETDFGIFNGETFDRLHERYPRKTDRIRTDGSDGVEGYVDERKRAEEFVRDTILEYGEKAVVAVSHADTIRTIYGVLNGLSLDDTLSSEKGFCPKTGEMIRVDAE